MHTHFLYLTIHARAHTRHVQVLVYSQRLNICGACIQSVLWWCDRQRLACDCRRSRMDAAGGDTGEVERTPASACTHHFGADLAVQSFNTRPEFILPRTTCPSHDARSADLSSIVE